MLFASLRILLESEYNIDLLRVGPIGIIGDVRRSSRRRFPRGCGPRVQRGAEAEAGAAPLGERNAQRPRRERAREQSDLRLVLEQLGEEPGGIEWCSSASRRQSATR